jgi:dolichol kinase
MSMIELKRQAAHAAGILSVIPLLLWGKWIGVAVTGTVLAFFILLALWRHGRKHVTNALDRLVESFVTGYERIGERPVMGAITFYAGASLAILIFDVATAAAAIAVLAIADSVSTVIGVYFGNLNLTINPKKSWEGSLTFWLAAFATLLVFVNPMKAFLVSLMAMTVEALPRIDDNLSVPVTVGVLLTVLEFFNI